MGVPPGVHDGVPRSEWERLESLEIIPKSAVGEEVMDLQLAIVLVVGKLTADVTVGTTGRILATLFLHTSLQQSVIVSNIT